MKVRYQYTDFSEWEGPPEDAHKSPDKGIVRMFAICDHDTELTFTYQDVYYLYPVEDGWLFGACTPWREFILRPGQLGCSGDPIPFDLPERAVVRHGETVSQEDAVKFGLLSHAEEKLLHKKERIKVNKCKDCGE